MVFVSEYFLSKRLKLVYSPHMFDNELVYIKPIEYNLNSNRIVDEDRLEKNSMIKAYTPVAQLDRALVSGTKSRRFESSQACHIIYKKGHRAAYPTEP